MKWSIHVEEGDDWCPVKKNSQIMCVLHSAEETKQAQSGRHL
jgi:hypothetical protein